MTSVIKGSELLIKTLRNKLPDEQRRLFLSTGFFSLPPNEEKGRAWFDAQYWPFPRIVTPNGNILATAYSADRDWFFAGEWKLSPAWESLCGQPQNGMADRDYLISVEEWYSRVLCIVLSEKFPVDKPSDALVKPARKRARI